MIPIIIYFALKKAIYFHLWTCHIYIYQTTTHLSPGLPGTQITPP